VLKSVFAGDAMLSFGKKRVYKTSLTDNGEYPDFCFLASVNSHVFSNFKQNPIYTRVLEHVSKELGAEYLHVLRERGIDEKTIELCKENDLYGSPTCYEYEGVGRISPTTLRYIKVLQDLQREFGSLDNLDIVELGVGYGGQCRLIAACFKVKSYTLVDLPQVLSLAKAYLNNYPLSARLEFLTMNELDSQKKYDLFISNYAFSELRLPIQNCYFEKTIRNASRGYITYNNNLADAFEKLSLDDYEKKIPNLKIIDENPQSSAENKVLLWK
jgi:putative sugar O-methyltransferase